MQCYHTFDELPAGCLAFQLCSGRLEPLFQRGQSLVVDINNREPEHGALVLRRFGSSSYPSDRFAIVETKLITGLDGGRWWLQEPGEFFADGGFAVDGEHAWYVRDRIVGRVIGILRDHEPITVEADFKRAEARSPLPRLSAPIFGADPVLSPS